MFDNAVPGCLWSKLDGHQDIEAITMRRVTMHARLHKLSSSTSAFEGDEYPLGCRDMTVVPDPVYRVSTDPFPGAHGSTSACMPNMEHGFYREMT